MTAFEKLKLREGRMGKTQKEQMIENSRYIIESLLPDDPSYKKNVEIMDKGFISLRMNNRRIVNKVPQINIQASLSSETSFKMSDVFVYDNGYWLCTDSYNLHGIYKTGIIEECNYLLTWQNTETLEIVSRWCVAKNPYASGLDEGKILTSENGRLELRMPYDDETNLLFVDKRFLIGHSNRKPRPYKLIEFNDVTYKYESRKEGFLSIVVKRDELMPDDNWDLMIADYIEPSPLPPTPIGSCEILYKGDPVLKAGSRSKTFTAVFQDSEGEPIDTIVPIWNIVSNDSMYFDDIEIVNQSSKEITLKAKSNATIGNTFSLILSADDATYGFFETKVKVEISGLV